MDAINELAATLDKMKQLLHDLKKKNDYLGEMPYRVIHLIDNPAAKEIQNKESMYDSIKSENERLRARLSILESGNNADVTMRIDDAVNSSHQIELLSQKVNQLKAREEKILNSFKKTSREFREVCYLLTGYRIDPLKDDIFRLSHMYAEREEDKLFFEVKREGTTLLKNEYTDRYSENVSTYLEGADSFPAFLASITLDLFKSSTQAPNCLV